MGTCVQCGSELSLPARGRKPRYCSRSCQARAYRARVRARAEQAEPARPPQSELRNTGTPAALSQKGEGLSLQLIIGAAIQIADTEGLEALSMRRVAAMIGVATMSLYHYVSSKDELIDLMVEKVFNEGEQSFTDTSDWRTGLEFAARWEWALYSRHPWALQVMATVQQPLVPSLLAYGERARAALDGLGLDPVTAHRVVLSVAGLVQGLALLRVSEIETMRHGADSVSEWRAVKVPAALEAMGDAQYPRLAALRNHEEVVDDLDRLFEFCLSRVLDGLALFLEGIEGAAAGGHAEPRASTPAEG